MIITLALRRTATIETLSRTIFQFRLLRGDTTHTRHRCVRLAALSELADRFRSIRGQEWTSRHKHRCVRLAALSELADRFRSIRGQEWTRPPATNGYNDSPHTLRCKRSLQGFTTEPIPCPVEETPDEFPIKARSSSYEQRNPITLFEMPIVVAEHDLIRRTGRTSRIFGPFSRLPFSAAPDSPHVPPQFSNPKTDTT